MENIQRILAKLGSIEERLAENRIRLDEVKTSIAFWGMITKNFEDLEEETND